MKKTLNSTVTMEGRRMAGARALWRAAGMKPEQMGRPVVAIANSFTQFVPGHTHLHEAGQIVKAEVERLGCYAAEFNTIAVDDGIAMGHDGMLYSLPSRELIADSVEYMVRAHRADALVCISNCDKVTPGMLMAAMRLNVPTVFVSGGPMEAGRWRGRHADLITAMVAGADPSVTDEELAGLEACACPGCGSCSGMFTANSMNCLTEALGLALPGNGTLPATHAGRRRLMQEAGRCVVELARRHYEEGDESVLPRSIAGRAAFMNAMALDMGMGGSTNTVLHLLAVAREGDVPFTLDDIDALSRRVPCLCKLSPNSARYAIEDCHRAGGVLGIMGELARAGLLDTSVGRADGLTLAGALAAYDVCGPQPSPAALELYACAPGGRFSRELGGQEERWESLDTDRAAGCIRDVAHAYTADGGLAVLRGNLAPDGCVVKTAGVDPSVLTFSGPARVFCSQEEACRAILDGTVVAGDAVVITHEGPAGGPGMQEMLYPTSYLKSRHLGAACALVTDGRFSGGTSGLSIGHVSPEAAAGGPIGKLRDGDIIDIDIPARRIAVRLSDEELAARAPRPVERQREVSRSLRAYAALVTSADKGAVRRI